MKKPLMIGAALLVAVGAFGAGVGASESHLLRHERHASEHSDRESSPMRLADRGSREHHAERDERRHKRHSEHKERHERRRGAVSETGPVDPNAPTPDNGLFNKGGRPKVEVQ